ncbi:hypothetical protein VHA01S_004_00020 [Vibrio halioticoli NBRC 102217]|uniref:Uncharacterized protein n=1 Tax=Vibrio halioticoli NBRC 102217 TaxID=1219072 RepID=V5FGP7_9VIBR|nr:hypothetical protein VHA01S_004_00020 [Vibrio halioticoli NBRC 102217]
MVYGADLAHRKVGFITIIIERDIYEVKVNIQSHFININILLKLEKAFTMRRKGNKQRFTQ